MSRWEATEGLLYLTLQQVQDICREIDSIALVREVFRLHGTSQTIVPDEAYLSWKTTTNEAVRSLNMPGYLGGNFNAAGTKIINSNPDNPKRGRPRASGLTLLFDPETVRVICVMDGAFISALRTASVSMLCVGLLAEQSFRCLTVIGAGVIGRIHIELAAKTFPSLERVILFDKDFGAAEALIRELETSMLRRIRIGVSENLEKAVGAADVIIPATTATKGYLHYDWLKPGSVVVNVSLDDLLPDVFLKSGLLFVDDWNLVVADRQRLLGKMYRQGLIAGLNVTTPTGSARRIDGEISDLVLGRHPGRRTFEEIVVVNPFGLAIEDIAFASRIFEMAKLRGIGIPLVA